MNAEEILRASLADIKAGYWCGGTLAEYGLDAEGRMFNSQDVGADTSNWEPFTPYEQPKGCAIGLVSIYGGVGYEFRQQVDGVEFEGFCPTYPSESFGMEEDEPVVGALLALYETLPDMERGAVPAFDDLNAVETAVLGYNDSTRCTQEKAIDWFRRALASVTEKAAV